MQDSQDFPLASRIELDRFLEQVERRAFKQAMFALRNEETALDVVQDAMLRLVVSYSGRPAGEFPMFFQRIVQNAIRDQMRRQKVRRLWVLFVSAFTRDDDELSDPLDACCERRIQRGHGAPSRVRAERDAGDHRARDRALPARQREAFLMRYWEELDIAETAAAMGCSEGASRRIARVPPTFAAALRARGIKP